MLAGLDLRRADVLKVPHHGSADPGLAGVLARVAPRVAVIEVGAHNTYGHPAPQALQALRARTCRSWPAPTATGRSAWICGGAGGHTRQ